MVMDSLPKRATVDELMKITDRKQGAVRRSIKAKGLKADKQHKYLTAPVLEAMAEAEARDTRNIDPDAELHAPTTWADKLKAKQVEKLQVQIDQLRGNLVPMDEVRSLLAEHSAAVKGALENFVQHVAAGKRDAELLAWAEQARDAAVNGIREAI
jgi:hypothetical protein